MSWIIKVISIFILSALVFSLVVFVMTGCTTPPDKKDFATRPNACYDFMECLYLNAKNPDKSICIPLSMECRAYDRFNFCKDSKNLPERIDFNQCQLYLNQK